MDILKQYTIAHQGLSIGSYDYNFEINGTFFKAFQSEVETADLKVELVLEKTSQVSYRMFVQLEGTVAVNCGRCELPFQYPLNLEKTIPVKVTDKTFEDDDVLIIHHNDYQIELAQLFYEMITLTLPMVIIPCELEGYTQSICDQEVLKTLEAITPKEEPIIDPRWSGLQQFLK